MRHTQRLLNFTLAALLALLALPARAPSQEVSAVTNYRVFDASGKPATIEQVLDAAAASEVVYVGEIHNDATAHQLELQLLQGAFARLARGGAQGHATRPLVLSLEMFERDVQLVLDEYLAGLIQEKHFRAASRPWNNYETDYRPLVEFAREHQLPVVAANAPERYVNRVGRLGRDALKSLAPAALAQLAPLPYGQPSAAYAEKFSLAMGGAQMGAHANPFLLDAQALRDATMAYSIASELKRQPQALVLHVNGGFHSESRLGVPEQLRALRPQTRQLVVTIRPAPADQPFDQKEHGGLGDFVILTTTAASGRF
ncbi:MAG TPA: ChaN family lipoprotein [Pyrinomonadaceae bacterium]|jgi:uncharacterized iron-regulated protein